MPTDQFDAVCISLSYQNVRVELLERLSVPDEGLPDVLREIARRLSQQRSELVLLSTCNRIELYGTEHALRELATEYFAQRSGMSTAFIDSSLRLYSGREAAKHLFRVACGLESLVVGESQILGQVESAYAAAQLTGTAGPGMAALFQTAIRCGKRARNETKIGQRATNISSLAVHLAEGYAGDLSQARVLVVGSGEMGRLAIRALHDRGARTIDLVNRRFDHAAEVARRWGAKAHLFHDLPCLLASADVVLSSTSAPEPIITAAMVREAMEDRPGRPLVLVDIAVPRDVDPDARTVPGVHLFDVDDLKALDPTRDGATRCASAVIHPLGSALPAVDPSPGGTTAPVIYPFGSALPEVDRIIEEELVEAGAKNAEIALRPVIAELWRRAEEIQREVLDHTRAHLPDLDEQGWRQVENLAQALVNKLLHAPATRLRAEAANGHAVEYAEALRYLFDLPVSGALATRDADKAER